MINYKRKQIELILILVITAILANFLNDFDIFSHNVYPVYNQMLFISIGYICIAKLNDIKKTYSSGMVFGQIIFLGLCGLLYYSKTIVDYVTFGVCLYSVITTIMYLKDKLQ